MAIYEKYSPSTPPKKEDPLKKQSATIPSTPENQTKIWEEEIEFPERKKKSVSNPWE
jgi:hypothetical protein